MRWALLAVVTGLAVGCERNPPYCPEGDRGPAARREAERLEAERREAERNREAALEAWRRAAPPTNK